MGSRFGRETLCLHNIDGSVTKGLKTDTAGQQHISSIKDRHSRRTADFQALKTMPKGAPCLASLLLGGT